MRHACGGVTFALGVAAGAVVRHIVIDGGRRNTTGSSTSGRRRGVIKLCWSTVPPPNT